jgi:guanylate kinase
MIIIGIMGKSGTGKSTVIEELCKDERFHYVKSHSTREPRTNDPRDLKTHTFVNEEFYLNSKDKVISLFLGNGYRNWTDESNFDEKKINLYAIDSQAFVKLFKEFPEWETFGIYLKIDEATRLMRFLNRNDDKAFDTEEHLSEEPLNQIGNKEILNINNLSPEEVAEKIRGIIWKVDWKHLMKEE